MNYKDIPICDSLQALAMEGTLPDGIYLTFNSGMIRKVLVIDGIVSLYGTDTDSFVNRFGQNNFFCVNDIISKLNNKKWTKMSRLLKAEEDNKIKYNRK